MAAKEYIHFIDDLGVHLDKREFDNGAKIWDAAIRSVEALKPSHNNARAEICPHFYRDQTTSCCMVSGKLSPIA